MGSGGGKQEVFKGLERRGMPETPPAGPTGAAPAAGAARGCRPRSPPATGTTRPGRAAARPRRRPAGALASAAPPAARRAAAGWASACIAGEGMLVGRIAPYSFHDPAHGADRTSRLWGRQYRTARPTKPQYHPLACGFGEQQSERMPGSRRLGRSRGAAHAAAEQRDRGVLCCSRRRRRGGIVGGVAPAVQRRDGADVVAAAAETAAVPGPCCRARDHHSSVRRRAVCGGADAALPIRRCPVRRHRRERRQVVKQPRARACRGRGRAERAARRHLQQGQRLAAGGPHRRCCGGRRLAPTEHPVAPELRAVEVDPVLLAPGDGAVCWWQPVRMLRSVWHVCRLRIGPRRCWRAKLERLHAPRQSAAVRARALGRRAAVGINPPMRRGVQLGPLRFRLDVVRSNLLQSPVTRSAT